MSTTNPNPPTNPAPPAAPAAASPQPQAAMTYSDSAMLMTDPEFRGRIKVAVLHYADYILNEATGTPAHKTRTEWAVAAFKQPDQKATELHPPVVMDASVQENGKDVTDAQLQSAVEGVVNRLF